MSVKSTAVVNVPLTTYAQGIAQDRVAAARLANLIMPIVQVVAATGTFKKYDQRNDFLVEETERPVGGVRKRLTMDKSDGTYNCKPHGLEIGKDDFEDDLAGGSAAGAALDQQKVRMLMSREFTSYAYRSTGFAFSNLTAVAGRGNWSNQDIDPLDQIDEQLEGLAGAVNTTENITVVMGLASWRLIRANAKVKARLGLQSGIALKRQDFLEGLLYPVGFEVSSVMATLTKRGQAAADVSKSGLMNGYCLLLHSVPNPSPLDASAFKCFSTAPALVASVRTYRDETSNSDIHAVDWSEDMEVTGSACARLLAIS